MVLALGPGALVSAQPSSDLIPRVARVSRADGAAPMACLWRPDCFRNGWRGLAQPSTPCDRHLAGEMSGLSRRACPFRMLAGRQPLEMCQQPFWNPLTRSDCGRPQSGGPAFGVTGRSSRGWRESSLSRQLRFRSLAGEASVPSTAARLSGCGWGRQSTALWADAASSAALHRPSCQMQQRRGGVAAARCTSPSRMRCVLGRKC